MKWTPDPSPGLTQSLSPADNHLQINILFYLKESHWGNKIHLNVGHISSTRWPTENKLKGCFFSYNAVSELIFCLFLYVLCLILFIMAPSFLFLWNSWLYEQLGLCISVSWAFSFCRFILSYSNLLVFVWPYCIRFYYIIIPLKPICFLIEMEMGGESGWNMGRNW